MCIEVMLYPLRYFLFIDYSVNVFVCVTYRRQTNYKWFYLNNIECPWVENVRKMAENIQKE